MLIETKKLKGYKIIGNDGEIGRVKDFYFDNHSWAIHYIVVDTGSWLIDRLVLISTNALITLNKETETLGINLSIKQIEDSPILNINEPVTREFEEAYFTYYGLTSYCPDQPIQAADKNSLNDCNTVEKATIEGVTAMPNLLSSLDINGYSIYATDGEIGHVSEFIIENETWAIRYLIINTHNWLEGKHVLISPKWIDQINWDEKKVFINHSRDRIKLSPEFSVESLVTRDYEIQLHRYYNRNVYWPEEPSVQNHRL